MVSHESLQELAIQWYKSFAWILFMVPFLNIIFMFLLLLRQLCWVLRIFWIFPCHLYFLFFQSHIIRSKLTLLNGDERTQEQSMYGWAGMWAANISTSLHFLSNIHFPFSFLLFFFCCFLYTKSTLLLFDTFMWDQKWCPQIRFSLVEHYDLVLAVAGRWCGLPNRQYQRLPLPNGGSNRGSIRGKYEWIWWVRENKQLGRLSPQVIVV